MKLEKDRLSYVLAVIPGALGFGYFTISSHQNFMPLLASLILLFMVIAKIHQRIHKLQVRVEELEDRLSQISHIRV